MVNQKLYTAMLLMFKVIETLRHATMEIKYTNTQTCFKIKQ